MRLVFFTVDPLFSRRLIPYNINRLLATISLPWEFITTIIIGFLYMKAAQGYYLKTSNTQRWPYIMLGICVVIVELVSSMMEGLVSVGLIDRRKGIGKSKLLVPFLLLLSMFVIIVSHLVISVYFVVWGCRVRRNILDSEKSILSTRVSSTNTSVIPAETERTKKKSSLSSSSSSSSRGTSEASADRSSHTHHTHTDKNQSLIALTPSKHEDGGTSGISSHHTVKRSSQMVVTSSVCEKQDLGNAGEVSIQRISFKRRKRRSVLMRITRHMWGSACGMLVVVVSIPVGIFFAYSPNPWGLMFLAGVNFGVCITSAYQSMAFGMCTVDGQR